MSWKSSSWSTSVVEWRGLTVPFFVLTGFLMNWQHWCLFAICFVVMLCCNYSIMKAKTSWRCIGNGHPVNGQCFDLCAWPCDRLPVENSEDTNLEAENSSQSPALPLQEVALSFDAEMFDCGPPVYDTDSYISTRWGLKVTSFCFF